MKAELNAPQDVITCNKTQVGAMGAGIKLSPCIPMNTEQFSVVSSIYTLGGLSGALASGPCCNKYGRLITMRIISFFLVLGPVFESFAGSIGVLCLGRILSGVGAGAAIVVVPIYISEVAPPKEKGLFGALTQIMINMGILIAQLLGYFLSRDNLWRIILGTAGIISFVQLLGLFLVPESPKWLVENNKPLLARKILRKIRGHHFDIDEEVKAWNIDSSEQDIGQCPRRHVGLSLRCAEEEETLLEASSGTHPTPNPKASKATVGIFGAILHPDYQPAVIAVIAVMLAQQLTGINSIIMYSVHLLHELLPTTATLLTVAVSALNVIITTACAPLSDKIGRKTCLLLSIAGMGISSLMLALGIYYSIKVLSALATLAYVASFGVGLGPVPFILANELVGPEAVGATQSWALAANWIATFLVSQFFPLLDKALGRGRVYYIFAGVAVLSAAFIAWWVPETKGKHGAEEVWGRKEARERVE